MLLREVPHRDIMHRKSSSLSVIAWRPNCRKLNHCATSHPNSGPAWPHARTAGSLTIMEPVLNQACNKPNTHRNNSHANVCSAKEQIVHNNLCIIKPHDDPTSSIKRNQNTNERCKMHCYSCFVCFHECALPTYVSTTHVHHAPITSLMNTCADTTTLTCIKSTLACSDLRSIQVVVTSQLLFAIRSAIACSIPL